jgi:hypothetical protein
MGEEKELTGSFEVDGFKTVVPISDDLTIKLEETDTSFTAAYDPDVFDMMPRVCPTTITYILERVWWAPWTWFWRTRTCDAHVVDFQQTTSEDGELTCKITLSTRNK